MIRWIPYTFVRTVFFFICGILVAFYFPDLLSETSAVAVIVAFACLYFIAVRFRTPGRRHLNPGWIALPFIFFLGCLRVLSHTESNHDAHLLHASGPIDHYSAVITGFPEERARTWKVQGRVTQVRADSIWHVKTGNVLLYFRKDAFQKPFLYGDVLLIKGSPLRPEGPGNPDEFDYKAHLALKNIYHQHFLTGDDVLKTGHSPPSRVMALAFNARQWAGGVLADYIEGDRERGIASGLVLGVTDGVDNELLDAYSASGSMHILAVSGLHVSIIYLILLKIFSPLNKLRGGRWWVALISLSILWLYAFITGLTPSVLRAVTMFSFLAVARPWSRSTNIYNTLAVSAFLLLLFNPFLLFSVGFQLSYMAVLGIVYLYPRILQLWEPDHTIAVEVWKLSAVALAAQLATFPLGLLYFHQFPNYFLLSNLLVVPLSFVVLILGLVVLAVSFIPAVAMTIAFCLEWVIRFLNFLVFAIDDLPFSVIGNVYISAWQCFLLLLSIVFVLALLHYKKFVFLCCACFSFATFGILQWIHFNDDVDVKKLAVYKVPRHSLIDLIDRGQSFFLADSLFTDDQKIRYHITPHRVRAGVSRIKDDIPLAYSFKGGRLIVWQGKMIVQVLDRDFALPGPLEVDWIIVGNNAVADPAKITGRLTCRRIVLDSSNSYFFASDFLEEAKLYKLEVHSVLHQGAFIQTIENEDS